MRVNFQSKNRFFSKGERGGGVVLFNVPSHVKMCQMRNSTLFQDFKVFQKKNCCLLFNQ